MQRILLLCAERPVRFSVLKRRLRFTDAGLAKDLHRLASGRLLVRGAIGYETTKKGRALAKKFALAEDLKKQKPPEKLLLLQKRIHPREVFAFKHLKAVLKQAPLTVPRYEALAVAEGLEVTCDRELAPVAAVSAYANALPMISAALQPSRASCRLVVSLNLNRGLDVAQTRLEREIEDEWDQAKRRKLETILKEIRTHRSRVLRDIHKRFLSPARSAHMN